MGRPPPRHGTEVARFKIRAKKKKNILTREHCRMNTAPIISLVRNVQINSSSCVVKGEKGKGVHVVRSKTASINVHLRLARQTRPVNRASTTFGRLATLLGVSAHAS